jgi:ABC-2 type transport system permease protein
MLTPAKLFLKRLAAHGAFQWNVFRLVVDWIIALYFIVPALVFAGFQYHSWWSASPVWIEHVPFIIVVLALYGVATMGTVRLFVEEADQLFLLQYPRWMQLLKQLGMAYSFLFHMLISTAAIALLAPLLLVHYVLTPNQLVLLFLFLLAFRSFSAFMKHFLSLRYAGWRLWLGTIGLQLVMVGVFISTLLYMKDQPVVWCAEIVLLAALSFLSMRYRLQLKGTFLQDIEHEQTQRLKFIALLLRRNVGRKPKKSRLKPWFYSSSSLIFKHRTPANGLVELYLKSFVRSGIQLRLYIQFIAVGAGILAIPMLPKPIKIILWLLLSIFFCNWLKSYWIEVLESPFVQMFSWENSDRQGAASKGIFYVMLPGYMLLSLALGLSSFTWVGTLQILLFGGVVAYMVTNIMITISYAFRKQVK